MSIYRTLDRRPTNDVYAPEERRLTLVPSPTASQVDTERDKYQHLRKATPANVAFPRTLTWVETLPSDVQPKALLRRYPRIANLIAAVWADRVWLRNYMDSLLTDTRGDRQGFPPDVLKDLLALRSYCDELEKQPPTWIAVGKRG